MISFKPVKMLYEKLILSHATPKEVAFGFALGVFIALTPTLGFQTAIAIGLCTLFRANQLGALLGVWVTNPLTAFPIYYYVFKVGQFVLQDHSAVITLHQDSLRNIFEMGGELLMPLWAGGIVTGILSAIVSYYLTLFFYPYLKSKQQQIRQSIGKKT